MSCFGWLVNENSCPPEEITGLEHWNYQWTQYFLAKAIYHFLLYMQLFSTQLKIDICEELEEFRTAEEEH